MESIFTELLGQFGPLVGIILFFVWRDWKREDALSTRVEQLENYQRDTLVHLVERSTTALVQNADCLSWVARVMERLCGHYPYTEVKEDAERG